MNTPLPLGAPKQTPTMQLLNEIQLLQTALRRIRLLPFNTVQNWILDNVELAIGELEWDALHPEEPLQRQPLAQRMMPAQRVRGAQPMLQGQKHPGMRKQLPAQVDTHAAWNQFKSEFQPRETRVVIIPQPFPNGPQGVAVWRGFRSYLYFRPAIEQSYPWTMNTMIEPQYDIEKTLPQKPLVITEAGQMWNPPPELQLDDEIWAIRKPGGWMVWEPQWQAWLKG